MIKACVNSYDAIVETAKILERTFLMDPYIKITKKIDSKVINMQHFHRKTGLKMQFQISSDPIMNSKTDPSSAFS